MYKTCPHCGSHLDPGETCDCRKEPEAVSQKRIVTREDWAKARDFMKAANPGDLVVEEIVDEMRDCVPPASMSAGYLQVGEPYSHELDPETGRWRATYMTFCMVGQDWQYCGCCFLGKTEQPQALTDKLNHRKESAISMEFCRNRCCPFEDCEQHPRHAPRGFAYTAKAMDENCDRYKEYLAREEEKQQRIREMTFGTAYRIFADIENPDVSDEEKGAAILKIVNMETHNSVTKASMLKVIRWLLELSFELPEKEP